MKISKTVRASRISPSVPPTAEPATDTQDATDVLDDFIASLKHPNLPERGGCPHLIGTASMISGINSVLTLSDLDLSVVLSIGQFRPSALATIITEAPKPSIANIVEWIHFKRPNDDLHKRAGAVLVNVANSIFRLGKNPIMRLSIADKCSEAAEKLERWNVLLGGESLDQFWHRLESEAATGLVCDDSAVFYEGKKLNLQPQGFKLVRHLLCVGTRVSFNDLAKNVWAPKNPTDDAIESERKRVNRVLSCAGANVEITQDRKHLAIKTLKGSEIGV